MNNILKDFDRVYIKKISGKQKLRENCKENEFKNKSLVKKGFYNGYILNCESYEKKEKNIILNCQKFKFFDWFYNRKNVVQKIVNVNIIIKTKDNYLIIIKRGGNVSAYKYYWDFAAGLLPFGVSAYKRAINRVKEDTFI